LLVILFVFWKTSIKLIAEHWPVGYGPLDHSVVSSPELRSLGDIMLYLCDAEITLKHMTFI
jgi:hypothetical protein